MKKILNIFLLAVIYNSFPIPTKAQDNSTCFMVDSGGNRINLGSLCQKSTPRKQPDYFPYQDYSQPGVYSVPIKRKRSGIPVIDVKFNDRYVFEMMLDTGASQTTITSYMAKTLKVPHQGTVFVSTPSHNRVPMSAGYIHSVGVSDIIQKNHLVITAPNMDMGLLGQSFFGRYDLTIKQDRIEFRPR